MIIKYTSIALWAFLIWLAGNISMSVRAENHALLIGIGQYSQRPLQGPPYDVAALARLLLTRYDFHQENIHTLVNEEAVKSKILSEMELLIRRTSPGDRVFIYFSGHGTSRRDEVLGLPMPHTTGALVPADFNPAPNLPVDQLLSQLIIGRRDLRPTLERLDRDRQVLMVFDTCFSGNTVRAIGDRAPANPDRYLRIPSKSIFAAEQEIGSFDENLKPEAPYPYQNIFYIAASGENEVAKDIRADNLHLFPTIDGYPHGALTDALLRVLAGQVHVDTDNDGRWSQIELFAAAKAEVQRRFRQSPQALPKEGASVERLYTRSFFVPPPGGTAAGSQTPAVASRAEYRPDYSSSHALVVGIDKYQSWPPLEYAVEDAREMAAELTAQGFQIHILTDRQATLANILDKLATIRASVDDDSRVVFYFAGHGQTEDLPGGGERGYLVPVDADTYNWQNTMLPMDRLNQIIKQIRAKHIFMAFDSCYSGLGLTRSINRHPQTDSAYIRKMMASRSIQILTAGSRSEQAIEAAGHGLFTDHLLAALSGAADINSDGYITATEIYATLRPRITQKSYSRQTPQFGYIEGNGDIIFQPTPPKQVPATVLIDTAVSGIDVWAGTVAIGHRLPAGRHRLRTNAGQTIIIAKNGGRTLYRKNVRLSANQVFAVMIGAPAAASNIPPQTFSVLTIANRKVDNFSNSMAYDLDGDGRAEIITAADRSLYAFNSDGSVRWVKNFQFSITLNLIDDWNFQPAIALSAAENDTVHLKLLNSRGEEIWQHVRKLFRYRGAKPDGGGRIAGLADIDQDGRTEIVAVTTARHALKPRGIIVYGPDGGELWRYPIGPLPQNIVIWEKDGGRPDIVVGTYGSGDGNRELHNNTGDMQSYVISIDGFGQTNWIIPTGEYFTGTAVLLADLAGTGQPSLFAHTYAASNLRKDSGAIYKISRAGKIMHQYTTANSILSITADESTGGGHGCLYAVDNQSNLIKLDARLTRLQTKALHAGARPPQVRLVGVHDYDGDGSGELLMYSFHRLLGDKNPLAESVSDGKVFYSNLKFDVISKDFSRILKSVSIAEEWDRRRGFAVRDVEGAETAYYPFMVLSDKITAYNFRNDNDP